MYVGTQYLTTNFSIIAQWRIYLSNSQLNVQPELYWEGANSQGSFFGNVRTTLSGSFNFARQVNGTYSLYLDGVLTISNLSLGAELPNYAKIGNLMYAHNPCVEMDDTWTTSANLTGWTADTAQYFVLNKIDNFHFETYTLPF